MKVIVMGCGRVGGMLAGELEDAGHEVTVIDIDSLSFRWLPRSYKGKTLMGDGTDAEILRMAGIEGTDVFVATTQGDNRNVMAGQVAKHIFRVPRVVCRIYDPLREEMYRSLGLETMSPTKLSVDVLAKIVLGKGG